MATVLGRRHPKYGYHSLVFGQKVQEKGQEAARMYAERTARKAATIVEEYPRVLDPNEARMRLAQFRAAVDVEPWPLDLAGPRRALEAAFAVAFERGRVAGLHLDLRTHAMRAGQSFAKIRQHRGKLDELGWLMRNPRDRGKRTSRFRFADPRTHVTDLLLSLHVHASPLLGHDAYRPDGLGDEGWYVVQLLRNRAALPEKSDHVRDCLAQAGITDRAARDDDALLERLDLFALHARVFNTGYKEGVTFLKQRRERASVITCAQSFDVA